MKTNPIAIEESRPATSSSSKLRLARETVRTIRVQTGIRSGALIAETATGVTQCGELIAETATGITQYR